LSRFQSNSKVLVPLDFYMPLNDLRRLSFDARLRYVKNRLKNDKCYDCAYCFWSFLIVRDKFGLKVLDEFLVRRCIRKTKKGTKVKAVNRIIQRCRFHINVTLNGVCFNNLSKVLEDERMGKILDLPPPIDKSLIDREGTDVKITKAYIEKNVYTSLGQVPVALIVHVRYGKDNLEGYQMWSIPSDRPLGGSASRIIKGFLPEITDTDQLNNDVLKKLEGKVCVVKNRGDKLYWYPKK